LPVLAVLTGVPVHRRPLLELVANVSSWPAAEGLACTTVPDPNATEGLLHSGRPEFPERTFTSLMALGTTVHAE
jgi:hypothetical protein